jgi:hypothetical protein
MRLLMAIVAVAAVELGDVFVFLSTHLEENCDNGISRWQCSGVIRGVSGVVFWVLLVALLLLLLVALWRLISAAARRISG